jgi:hypothetical protein
MKGWSIKAAAFVLAALLAAQAAAQEAVVFSPNGRFTASVADGGTVQVREAESGRALHTLSGFGGRVTSLEFSPDSRRILSLSGDGTVTIWDRESGEKIFAFSDPDNMIASATFSHNGRRVVSVSAGGKVEWWTWVESLGDFSSDSSNFVLGNLNLSFDTDVLEDGSRTDFSLGYRYAPSTSGELRLRYVKTSYNDDMYGLAESLTANDEQVFEVFLLPFRRHFFDSSTVSFSAAAGMYYDYNTVEQHGYFNRPDLAPDSLNMYRNDFTAHLLGPLAEAGLRFRTRPVDVTLDLGIVPLFYMRRDQSMQMKPFMGPDFFDHSQDTGGSPYFYGALNGVFFKFLSLGVLYEYSKIDYDVISIPAKGTWSTPAQELVSQTFRLEASILLPLGGLSLQVGYGHSFTAIEIDSGTPVNDNGHYLIIGTKKNRN